ncbi:MAG: indole-3-glycerol phosphate synthase TrpC [Desulfuromonadales bacterium]|nr:indole-3-glycerol phosphate synthase TrpC [Desulfuromonadales bacterium]
MDKTDTTPDILKKIVAHKREELLACKARIPLRELRRIIENSPPTRGFEAALRSAAATGKTAIIAEVKKGSPSKGLIRADFDPLTIAQIYATNGAICLSVLTDEHFFMGHLDYLNLIRRELTLPLLRKDFILDDYQVYEARCAGADAILLIASMLDLHQIIDFIALARGLSLDILLEVHDESEMETALRTDCTLIGVNNRNLRTFVTDLDTTRRLARMVSPDRLLVAESGISTRDDIERLTTDGASAFLIGESLMRENDIASKLRELQGY